MNQLSRAPPQATTPMAAAVPVRPASDRRGVWLAWVPPCLVAERLGQRSEPGLGVAAAPRWAHAGLMAPQVVTVNDVLDGHVALDIECLDRIYLNAYVPILQTSSQVVAFLSGHLGFPFPSPALFRQMGDRFRRAVLSFSDANDIPWIRFEKDEPKLGVMQPHLARQAGTGRSGVAAIGVAQEFQRVWTASEGKTSTGTPRWSFYKADRRVTCYYF